MRIYQAEDYKAMSRRAANIISAQVIYKPNCVLGLATGGTPVGLYKQLVDWYKKGDLSFAETRSVNLDEYLGLSPHHEQSYRYFMQVNLFDHIDIKPENTHVLDGLAKNPQPSAPPTTGSSATWAASISSCWAWATTATSPSTSPATTLAWNALSQSSPTAPSTQTSASLRAGTRCPATP